MIDLSSSSLAEVRRILARRAAGWEVRAFGSRVEGTARRFSDLDLAVLGGGVVPPGVLEALRDAFSESDLPISVDVAAWDGLPQGIRDAVGDRFVVLQSGREEKT